MTFRTWTGPLVAACALFGLAQGASANTYRDASPEVASAAAATMTDTTIQACILAAAALHRLPAVMLVILLRVEGGTIGHVSQNIDNSVDVGPMQVNQVWLPKLAQHWHASIEDTFVALRDNFCANVEGGAWILRQGLDEARGDFWGGVGIYHSHDPGYQAVYLHQVLRQVLALQELRVVVPDILKPAS
jgi:hypothetical protein